VKQGNQDESEVMQYMYTLKLYFEFFSGRRYRY